MSHSEVESSCWDDAKCCFDLLLLTNPCPGPGQPGLRPFGGLSGSGDGDAVADAVPGPCLPYHDDPGLPMDDEMPQSLHGDNDELHIVPLPAADL